MLGVAKQGKSQVVFIIELLLLFLRIRADADNNNAALFQVGQCVPHRLGLNGSAGCARLRVEEDKDYFIVHLSDGDVIHHEGNTGEEIIRYTPELDTGAALQICLIQDSVGENYRVT